MLDKEQLDQWTEIARRDDWHLHFVGSDIRVMLGEINRLRVLHTLFDELKASGWTMHGLYERGPPRPDLVGDECIKHWNCRLCHSDEGSGLFAFGTAETVAEAIRSALDDIPRAIADRNRPSIPATKPKKEFVNVSLDDLGL